MLISILIPAYARPDQLAEALQSIAQQDRTLIGEIIIGDDSPRSYWARNQEVIAESGLAELIEYVPAEPSRGTYPNQWFLASRAKCDRVMFLHNDDTLCPGALRTLVEACERETDARVELWFGTQLIMDESGRVDPERSAASDQRYGRQGGAAVRPVWEWCLTEAIPSNAFIVERAAYLQHMRGARDGNVGDWGFAVRLANAAPGRASSAGSCRAIGSRPGASPRPAAASMRTGLSSWPVNCACRRIGRRPGASASTATCWSWLCAMCATASA